MNALRALAGSSWRGTAELWVDPLGDEVQTSDCTLSIEADGVRYSWSHEGARCEGRISLREGEDGADFEDSWHQTEAMHCRRLAGVPGLFQIQGAYGRDLEWGWRIGLFMRGPTDQLVLQMTNIAPWGEEARAVRMTFARQLEAQQS